MNSIPAILPSIFINSLYILLLTIQPFWRLLTVAHGDSTITTPDNVIGHETQQMQHEDVVTLLVLPCQGMILFAVQQHPMQLDSIL